MDWAPRIVRAFEHYGIDYKDRKYDQERGYSGGWCPACRSHAISSPWPLCDLEIARAEDIREHGFEARHCFHCRKAYPTMLDRGSICPACRRKQQKRDDEFEAQLARRQVERKTDGIRIADGFGCVEKQPRWAVEWAGDPGQGEPR